MMVLTQKHLRPKRYLQLAAAFYISFYVVACTPTFPENEADGVYENSCCLALVLKSGTMQVGNRYVSYVIEADKEGKYVLPSKYVDIGKEGRISFNSYQFPLKMRLTGGQPPNTIKVLSQTSETIFYRRE